MLNKACRIRNSRFKRDWAYCHCLKIQMRAIGRRSSVNSRKTNLEHTHITSDEQPTAKVLYTRLLRNYVLKYKFHIAWACLFMVLAAIAGAATAFIMRPIVDEVFFEKNPDFITYTVVSIIGIFSVRGLASFGQTLLMNWVGVRVVADIQAELFRKLVHADLAWFHDNSPASLISRFVFDTNQLKAGATNTLVVLTKDSMSALFLVGSLFYYDWRMATVVVLVLPPGAFAIGKLGKRSRKAAKKVLEQSESFTAYLQETFQGIRIVKAYGQEKPAIARGDEVISKRYRLQYKSLRIIATSGPIVEILSGLVIAGVIFYGASNVISGETTPGTFFAFITALMLAYQPIKSVAKVAPQMQLAMAAAHRVFTLLDITYKVTDAENAKPLEFRNGNLKFNNVAFSYHKEEPVLKNISMDIKAGQKVALVGASGGGKSTILNLIPRFYDVNQGTITLDDQDLRLVTAASLRETIALVSQDVFLFDDTIKANISYGNPDATEEEILQAARDAAVHDFVMELPDKYDTVVGTEGIRLSGGQKQRIAIARAILKNAPILLLDEATSALDTTSEQKIQMALEKLMKGKTSLVIAHRLSTVLDADQICVVSSGEIVERGKHDELLQEQGVYSELYTKQFHIEK
ncbi:MAG: ABC transporter ATP-binding protein [Sneathiella sp.]